MPDLRPAAVPGRQVRIVLFPLLILVVAFGLSWSYTLHGPSAPREEAMWLKCHASGIAVAALLAVLLSACGGGSPTAPKPASINDIQLTTSPPSGSTVTMGQCGYFDQCTYNLSYQLAITLDKTVNQPYVRIRFYGQDGKDCAGTQLWTPDSGTSPGVVIFSGNYVGLDGQGYGWRPIIPNCSMPMTTTYVTVMLTDSDLGPLVFQKTFPFVYTWQR